MTNQSTGQVNQQQEDESRTFEHELAGKYLTCHLAEEYYGVPISPIDDIIEIKEITAVPQTADFVQGVINLRGSVIPVIDMRTKFGMDFREYDRKTCIIVITLDDFQTGLIVDRVDEVIEFADDEINPSPSMGHEIKTDFIAGMGRRQDDLVILLDLENILAEEEAEELREMQETE